MTDFEDMARRIDAQLKTRHGGYFYGDLVKGLAASFAACREAWVPFGELLGCDKGLVKMFHHGALARREMRLLAEEQRALLVHEHLSDELKAPAQRQLTSAKEEAVSSQEDNPLVQAYIELAAHVEGFDEECDEQTIGLLALALSRDESLWNDFRAAVAAMQTS